MIFGKMSGKISQTCTLRVHPSEVEKRASLIERARFLGSILINTTALIEHRRNSEIDRSRQTDG